MKVVGNGYTPCMEGCSLERRQSNRAFGIALTVWMIGFTVAAMLFAAFFPPPSGQEPPSKPEPQATSEP